MGHVEQHDSVNPQHVHIDPKHLVKVAENIGAKAIYAFRGVCLKCGWQSLQPDEQQAHDMVLQHAQRHIHGL